MTQSPSRVCLSLPLLTTTSQCGAKWDLGIHEYGLDHNDNSAADFEPET